MIYIALSCKQYTVNSVQIIVDLLQFSVYSLPYTIYIVYIVQCNVYMILFKVPSC